jgi:hypothetical protein
MPAVKSSLFSHIDYANGTLSVTMHSGKVYHHDDVPEATYKALMESKSIGAAYGSMIKSKHPHRKYASSPARFVV